MSDGGLPIIVGVITLACGLVGVFTNRRFGHPTFFAPHHKHSEWSIPIPDNADEKNKNKSPQQRPPPQPQHTKLPHEGPAVAAAERTLGRSSSSNVFADLPAAGVVEYIAAFLSPADLVGVAPICVDLSRVSACEVLWKAHCVRVFGKVDSVLGEPWREAQHRQQRRCEQSQCCETGSGDEPSDAARRRGRGQQQQQQRRLLDTQFRRNTTTMINGSSSSSSRRSLHPAEALTGGEDVPVKIDQPENSSSSSSNSSINSSSSLVTGTRTSDSTPTSSPSPPPSRTPFSPHPIPSSYHLQPPPCPCPSCSSVSWKEAFFYAHRERPRDLLELAPPATSCVVLVHGRVHDLTDFLPSHPGGSMILREHASTDATEAFERFFHSREARRIAREFVVWDGVEAMGREGTLWKVACEL